MRSIRLSLLVYFLALVSASLGVASLLIYRSARTTLREKEEATAKLIHANYEKRRDKESARLNEALLHKAQGLARRVQMKTHWVTLRERDFRQYFLLPVQPLPNAHVLAPVYLARTWGNPGFLVPGRPTPPPSSFLPSAAVTFDIPKAELVLPAEGDADEYFQIDSNYPCAPLRSASLGSMSFPVSDDFAPGDVSRWAWDDYQLGPGKTVRRVRFKAASTRQVPARPPPGTGRGNRGGPPRFWGNVAPLALLIQCGADLERLEDSLAFLREARDEELARLSEQTAFALRLQRNRLLTISALTFVATILGCFGLVWLGLLPLRRLSLAVSKITPKNFTLALGEKPLPAELQPIAERLNETLDQLRRAFAREKQATADISHELRAPLAALITTIELALRKPRSPEQYRELLQDSHDTAKQMHKIVERLLTLARLDAGVDRLRARSIDVAELAEQCALAVRPLAEARGLQLSVHNQCGDDPGSAASRVSTDPDKLREVLSNLLHNAIQYNRPSGKIDLVVGRDNGHVRVEVRDTGIGIPAETRERIFERFYRVDPSRTTDGLNAGLGLAIVKEYIELMGGHIRVESALGQGSTFRVDLPMQAPASAA